MSEGFFATAEVLVVPNTADFATALRAQLATAIAAAGPVVVPATAAVAGKAEAAAAAGSLSAAQKTQNTLVGRGAVLLGEEAVAAKTLTGATTKTAIAEEEAALATKGHARAASQAERAIGAQAASIAGLRGAALTASAPFLAATVAVIAFGKSIQAASNTTEELNKSAVVFGTSSKQIEDFAKTTATSLGISEVEALRAAGIFGNLFRTIHIATPTAAGMSERLVKLASDLASFNNADPSRVLEALRSGLVGQARPLRAFGIFISQARAQQEALIETGKKHVKELTNAELVQARFNIILKDSALAQGDFARTSTRLANQTRILKAELGDLAAEIGSAVIPGLVNLAGIATDVLGIFKDFKKIGDDGAKSLDKAAGSSGFFAGQLKEAEAGIGRLLVPGAELRPILDRAAHGMDVLAGTTNAAMAAVERGKESLTAANTRIATLFKTFQEGGGRKSSTALNEFVVGLQKLQQEEATGLVTNDEFAARIGKLIKLLQDPNAFKINVGATLDTEGLQKNARQAGHIALGALADTLSPQAGLAVGLNFILGVGTGIDQGTKEVKAKAASAGSLIAEQIALAAASGNQGAELAGLRTQAAGQKAFLDRITARPQTKANVALATKAANNLSATNAQIKAITDGIISDQKAAATDAKQAATKAAQAQQDATQAFIDLFSGPAQNLQNRLTEAQLSGSFTRQIHINKLIVAADTKEINAIKDRIRHLKLHGDALKLALATLKTLNQEIFNVQNAIDQLKEDRAQAVRDARQSHLEAQLAIAETTDTKKDDAAAEKALIAFDTAQIKRLRALKKRGKATRDEIALLDQYRVDLAQRNQALKELTATATKTHHLEFEFLQTQSGFAANLLGNLIPGLATGGLVGGTAAGGAPSGFPIPPTAKSTPSDDARRTAGTTAGGPSRGGQATTNALLRRIEKLLSDIYRGTGHPEAKHRQRRNLTNMDLDSHH